MKTFDILHIADVHLRDTQYGRTDRGRDFTESAGRIVDICMGRGIHYIVASGDILNCKRPSSKNIHDLLELNQKLEDADVTMLCIPGDHDWCLPSWIDTVKEHNPTTARIIDITDKVYEIEPASTGGHAPVGIKVYGAPRPCMHPEEFRQTSNEWPDADILLYHGPLKEFAGYPMGDDALGVRDLPTDKYQVIALGDLHARKYINYEGCLIGYPGPTEYCSANEKPEKTVTVLRFDNEGQLLKFDEKTDIIPLKTRLVLHGHIKSEEEMSTFLQTVRENAEQAPIVHAWHTPNVENVFKRICNVLDPRKGIIQTHKVADENDLTQHSFGLLELPEDAISKTPQDFAYEFASEGEPVYDLMVTLCDRDVKAGPTIDNYVDQRLASLDTNA